MIGGRGRTPRRSRNRLRERSRRRPAPSVWRSRTRRRKRAPRCHIQAPQSHRRTPQSRRWAPWRHRPWRPVQGSQRPSAVGGGGTKFDGLVGDRSASAIRHKGSRQKKEIERGLTRPSRKRQSEHREKTTAGAARERGLFTSTRFFRSPDLRAACRVAVASIDRFAALRSPVLLPCWPHLPFFPPALSLL